MKPLKFRPLFYKGNITSRASNKTFGGKIMTPEPLAGTWLQTSRPGTGVGVVENGNVDVLPDRYFKVVRAAVEVSSIIFCIQKFYSTPIKSVQWKNQGRKTWVNQSRNEAFSSFESLRQTGLRGKIRGTIRIPCQK